MENKSTALYPAVLAPQTMFLSTSKLFLPLVFLFVFGLLAIKSMWEVIAQNKRIQDRMKRIF